MLNFKKRLTYLLISIGVSIVVFLLFFFLLRANINNQLSQITDLTNRRATVAHSADSLSALIKDWEIAGKYKDTIAFLVPEKDKIVLLSKELQALAESHSIAFNFSFGTENDADVSKGLKTIGFTATAQGDFHKVFDFLQDIQNKYYALRIDTIDLTNENTGNNVKIFFTGQLFFAK